MYSSYQGTMTSTTAVVGLAQANINSFGIAFNNNIDIPEPATEQDSMPILAQRFAGLSLVNGRYAFTSVCRDFGTFETSEDARCKMRGVLG